jgi:hypothetical protein
MKRQAERQKNNFFSNTQPRTRTRTNTPAPRSGGHRSQRRARRGCIMSFRMYLKALDSEAWHFIFMARLGRRVAAAAVAGTPCARTARPPFHARLFFYLSQAVIALRSAVIARNRKRTWRTHALTHRPKQPTEEVHKKGGAKTKTVGVQSRLGADRRKEAHTPQNSVYAHCWRGKPLAVVRDSQSADCSS